MAGSVRTMMYKEASPDEEAMRESGLGTAELSSHLGVEPPPVVASQIGEAVPMLHHLIDLVISRCPRS